MNFSVKISTFLILLLTVITGTIVRAENSGLLSAEALGTALLDGTEILSFDSDPNLKNGWMELPFDTHPEDVRACFDTSVNLDMSNQETVVLGLTTDNPKAVGSLTLYFHAGNGWYSIAGQTSSTLVKNQPVQFTFNTSNARQEGNPDGLDKIDAVRIAVWRGASENGRLHLDYLKVVENGLIAVIADPDKRQKDAALGSQLVKTFASLGISLTTVTASSLSSEKLRQAKIVVIPVNANLNDTQVDILCNYVKNGGFLILFYSQPEKLMNVLGFKTDKYYKPGPDDSPLAEIRFDKKYVSQYGKTFPKIIRQQSHNIITAQPLPDDQLSELLQSPNDRPRIVAHWFDKDGKETPYPAILASGRGIYWSHILMNDFPDEKAQYLRSLFGTLDPWALIQTARKHWGELIDLGFDPTNNSLDITSFRIQSLPEILMLLKQKDWSSDEVKAALFDPEMSFNKRLQFIDEEISLIAQRTKDYCKKFPSKKIEGRFWWQHSGLGAYPGNWDQTMKELSESGFNGVIPNMLWGGSAMYESDILPRDPQVEKYGDQVAQAVAAGKKYGVEVHIWKVNWNCGRTPQSFIDEMTAAGRMQKSFSGETKPWLCPSDPRNRQLEADAMLEVATKYDVDGIHFDYIRYDGPEFCYCDRCRELFAKFYKETTDQELENWPESTQNDEKVKTLWKQWRCDQITELVREVRRRVDQERPDCKISAAVFPSPNSQNSIAQDWPKWIEEGLLDFVCPMDYTANPNNFVAFIENQHSVIQGKIPFYPGIGATSTGNSLSPAEVAFQIDITRRLGANGFTIFDLSNKTLQKYLPLLAVGPTSEKSEISDESPTFR